MRHIQQKMLQSLINKTAEFQPNIIEKDPLYLTGKTGSMLTTTTNFR